jgi:hypothetical protein
MASSSHRGRFSRFLSLVSLVCLIFALVYIGTAGNNCDRINRFVYVFNDVPAKVVLTVLAPWAQGFQFYWRAYDYFVSQRLVIADFLARQIYSSPSYGYMCLER